MTKDEALKMAIEALEDNQHYIAENERHTYVMLYNEIIDKCKEALEQPAWQGLTDDEIIDMYFQANISPQPAKDVIDFIRAIEQSLKDKNT
jgi:hypothetical protein